MLVGSFVCTADMSGRRWEEEVPSSQPLGAKPTNESHSDCHLGFSRMAREGDLNGEINPSEEILASIATLSKVLGPIYFIAAEPPSTRENLNSSSNCRNSQFVANSTFV